MTESAEGRLRADAEEMEACRRMMRSAHAEIKDQVLDQAAEQIKALDVVSFGSFQFVGLHTVLAVLAGMRGDDG